MKYCLRKMTLNEIKNEYMNQYKTVIEDDKIIFNGCVTIKQVLTPLEMQIEYVHLRDKYGYPVGDWSYITCRKNFKWEYVLWLKIIGENTLEMQLSHFC